MAEARSDRALRTLLLLFGLVFIFGVWPLMQIWSGFQWHPVQPEFEQMIVGIYVVLGVFLIMASKEPSEHRSLILFAAWSSIVHAAIMAVQAIRDTADRAHLIGDVPILFIVGIILLLLAPKRGGALAGA